MHNLLFLFHFVCVYELLIFFGVVLCFQENREDTESSPIPTASTTACPFSLSISLSKKQHFFYWGGTYSKLSSRSLEFTLGCCAFCGSERMFKDKCISFLKICGYILLFRDSFLSQTESTNKPIRCSLYLQWFLSLMFIFRSFLGFPWLCLYWSSVLTCFLFCSLESLEY